MRIGVLGPLEVSREGRPVALGGPKQRAVLAHLVVRANHVVPAETLIDQVWGDEPPVAARNSLQSYVSHLRKALGPDRLEGRAPGYVLHLAPEELDASRFETLLAEAGGTGGDTDRAAAILREALALWRGPAFADLAGEPALDGEITRLDELRLRAVEMRVEADLAAGRHGAVVAELEVLTRQHPLRERLWGSLMLALYRSGRQADGLATYGRARETLAEELGVDPSPELRNLHERILRQDPDLEIKGEPLRGYRLLERVGEGTFGVVYRAIQVHVGREVAVKAIHPELANQPDFVRRFEREAQLVARLEQPHVVPLYDYWREPGAAYLVMRYLRGGTLEDLLAEGRLPVERVADVLDQLASALATAHRQGVVHRDVKPGNVLLDEEGNAYLSDFGIAVAAGTILKPTETMDRETAAYLSPEQIRLEPTTPRSDVYSLGVVLFEMVTGGHPFAGESLDDPIDLHRDRPLPSPRAMRPDLPPEVDAVIARATAKDPIARFAGAPELAAAFRSAIAAPAGPSPERVEIRNPYKGLRAFLEADAADFFGRETLVRRLVERMAEPSTRSRFLCVVGPSGSGKSSVVRAGLLPALRRGAVDGSDRWFVVDVMPGRHPLRELEAALLGIAVEPPPSLVEELERDELGLAHAVERVLPDPEAELLIVLDQLDEAFTLVDDAERAQLLEIVRAAVEAPRGRLRVVATLRADLFDQPLSVRGFGELLAERTEAITPMTAAQLERSIVGPAERVGLEVEPGLAAAMVADVMDRPGALPLLQYALTELAEREERALTLDAYRSIGGVSGALARRAEALFQPLNQTARVACRQLFLRLVALADGTEGTRRRVRRSELMSLADVRSMDGVIETFGRHRLLTFDRDPDSREPTVEIAHEALIGEWDRLRDWVEASRDDLRLHARIAAATEDWMRDGRSPDDLLTGSKLAQAEEAAGGDSIALTQTERAYIDAAVAQREAEREAERIRHERELRLERRSVRRLRSLVAVLAVASLVAAGLTTVAIDRSREARRSAERETVGLLTSQSVASLNTDPDLSLVLAMHAVDAVSPGETVPAATVEALHWAIQEAGVEYPADGPVAVVEGPLGRRGVIDLPFADLAELVRANATRPFEPEECRQFFGTSACPRPPSSFPANLAAEPIRAIVPPDPARPLAGTTVTLYTLFLEEPWPADLQRELAAFFETTGIEVRHTMAPADFELWIRERVAAGDAPDLAFFSQPGGVASYARNGDLVDLGTYMNVEQLRRDQSPYLVSLGSVGAEGTSAPSKGGLYGAFVDLNVKSLVWYSAAAFRAAGYRVPESWDELIDLSDHMVEDGHTPWCFGFESDTADGWPGTDWIENIVLAGAGPKAYDRWALHDIVFDSPTIREAFRRLDQILFTDGYVYGGAAGAAATPFYEALVPMVENDPPACWLHQGGDFMGKLLPEGSVGTKFEVFPFPPLAQESVGAVMGGGDMVAAFVDRPEVRSFVRFLLSPEYGLERAPLGHAFISANRRFDLGAYQAFDRREADLVRQALADDAFRFDASDLMPPEVGQFPFWSAMMTYLAEGPDSLDRILAELDAAWPRG
jgi:serine/threonine protein kinase/ABC-type glycerol-3-phosphate transport system substrate-binding protein